MAFLREFIPRSDKARLIDLVKFKGVVDGSRKSRSSFVRGLLLTRILQQQDQYIELVGPALFNERSFLNEQISYLRGLLSTFFYSCQRWSKGESPLSTRTKCDGQG